MVASLLEESRVGDDHYFVARDAATAPRATRRVHLLPGFDEYLLGYTNRSLVLDPRHANAIVPGNNGRFRPTIVAGGRVEGTWKAATSPKGTVVSPQPFAPLSARDSHAVAVAAKRYAAFTRR